MPQEQRPSLARFRRERKTFLLVGSILVTGSAVTAVVIATAGPARWSQLVAAGVGIATSLIGMIISARSSLRLATGQMTYPDKITEIKGHLTSTSMLLRALQDDLVTRTAMLEQLEADADRYEKLASLNAEQAEAVEDLVGRQFKRQGRSAAIYWWAALVLAFLSGIVVNAITPTVLSWFS